MLPSTSATMSSRWLTRSLNLKKVLSTSETKDFIFAMLSSRSEITVPRSTKRSLTSDLRSRPSEMMPSTSEISFHTLRMLPHRFEMAARTFTMRSHTSEIMSLTSEITSLTLETTLSESDSHSSGPHECPVGPSSSSCGLARGGFEPPDGCSASSCSFCEPPDGSFESAGGVSDRQIRAPDHLVDLPNRLKTLSTQHAVVSARAKKFRSA